MGVPCASWGRGPIRRRTWSPWTACASAPLMPPPTWPCTSPPATSPPRTTPRAAPRPSTWPRTVPGLFPVGRLDMDSEGLLLLTTDGEWAQRVLHPRYGCTKEYLVEVEGRPAPAALARLRQPMQLGPQRVDGRGRGAPGGLPARAQPAADRDRGGPQAPDPAPERSHRPPRAAPGARPRGGRQPGRPAPRGVAPPDLGGDQPHRRRQRPRHPSQPARSPPPAGPARPAPPPPAARRPA